MTTSIIIPKLYGAGTRIRVAVNGVSKSYFRGVAIDVEDDVLAVIAAAGIPFRLTVTETIPAGNVLIPGTGARVRGTVNGERTSFPVGVPFPATQAVLDLLQAEGITFSLPGGFTVTPTPTPTPAPSFTTQPSVSPTTGTAGTTTYTATPGVTNGNVSSISRVWLLGSTIISTGLTASPGVSLSGSMTYQESVTGPGGTTLSSVQVVTVASAGGGTPTPGTLAQPQVAKTSGAGVNPLTFATTLPDNIDHTVNKLRGRRTNDQVSPGVPNWSGSSLVTSVTQLDENMIEGRDIPLAILNDPMPATYNAVQVREENADGSMVSEWSATVSDTFAPAFWTPDTTPYSTSGSSLDAPFDAGYHVMGFFGVATGGISVGGVAATLVRVQDYVAIYGVNIASAGTKTVLAGGGAANFVMAKGKLIGANTTPVATYGKAAGNEGANDHPSPAITIPAGGIAIAIIGGNNVKNFALTAGTVAGGLIMQPGASEFDEGMLRGMIYRKNDTTGSITITMGYSTSGGAFNLSAYAVYQPA